MAAADIMLRGGVGILRTMPTPAPEVLDRFRLQVAALGCPWPPNQPYGEYLRGLDLSTPTALAALHAAATLFRGAGYSAFNGTPPAQPTQAAVGAPYAHATAPLRRLVDRFVLVTCEALYRGVAVPAWVVEALPTLPAIMAQSDSLASRLDHESVDAVEAALLSSRVGETFDAAVIASRPGPPPSGTIQLSDPVVTTSIEGPVIAGSAVRATLVSADIATGQTVFALAT
jgi:exoribonuclease R